MKRSIQSLLLSFALLGSATAAFAQDSQDSKTPIVIQDPNLFNEGHLWVGRWSANADSNFWDDNFQNFKASRGRLGGVLFGGDYIHHVDRHNAFMLSAGGYANSISEPARHVLDEIGNPLEHHLDLDTLSLTVGYMFYPAGTGHPVIPYLGAGAGLYAGEIRSYQSSSSTETCTDDDDDSTCTTETSYTNSKRLHILYLRLLRPRRAGGAGELPCGPPAGRPLHRGSGSSRRKFLGQQKSRPFRRPVHPGRGDSLLIGDRALSRGTEMVAGCRAWRRDRQARLRR